MILFTVCKQILEIQNLRDAFMVTSLCRFYARGLSSREITVVFFSVAYKTAGWGGVFSRHMGEQCLLRCYVSFNVTTVNQTFILFSLPSTFRLSDYCFIGPLFASRLHAYTPLPLTIIMTVTSLFCAWHVMLCYYILMVDQNCIFTPYKTVYMVISDHVHHLSWWRLLLCCLSDSALLSSSSIWLLTGGAEKFTCVLPVLVANRQRGLSGAQNGLSSGMLLGYAHRDWHFSSWALICKFQNSWAWQVPGTAPTPNRLRRECTFWAAIYSIWPGRPPKQVMGGLSRSEHMLW